MQCHVPNHDSPIKVTLTFFVFKTELDIAPDFETLAARAPSAGDAMTPLETPSQGRVLHYWILFGLVVYVGFREYKVTMKAFLVAGVCLQSQSSHRHVYMEFPDFSRQLFPDFP